MKNSLTILSIIGAIFLFQGCEDWLDLRPENEVVLEDYWQNETQATQLVSACYRSFTEGDNMRRMIIWGEVRSDNIVKGNSTDSEILKILDVDINSSNSYSRWSSMYRTINYCNTFLHFAPSVIDLDENFTMGKYLSLEAEVLTLRALAYFYLVRAFGEVPLVTEPSIDDTQEYKIPKSSERTILDTIIRDLQHAERYARLSYDNFAYPKARVNQNAVRALLADVYLWDEQYANCVTTCNKILEDNTLELVEASRMLRTVFYSGSSSETIFELEFNDDEITNWTVRDFYGYSGDNSGQLSFPIFLATGERSPFNFSVGTEVESEEDIRYKDFLNIRTATSGFYYIFKYAGIQRTENEEEVSSYFYSSFSPSWIVYRLSDVMLMKAEALTQMNRDEDDLRQALRLVNTTYLRSNPDLGIDSLTFDQYSDQQKMSELVLRERQRELMFEGKRWFDLMRLARREGSPDQMLYYVMPKFTGNTSLQYSKMSTMEALFFPIHRDELDANPALEQNPFYELTESGYN